MDIVTNKDKIYKLCVVNESNERKLTKLRKYKGSETDKFIFKPLPSIFLNN